MAKNANADNDYWEEYERLSRNFRGTPEEFEDLVIEEDGRRRTKELAIAVLEN